MKLGLPPGVDVGVVLRSSLFNLLFFGWTALYALSCTPLILFPLSSLHRMARVWSRTSLWLLARTVGLRYQIRGREKLPDGPVVIASKHQSAWDTVIFFALLDRPAYVLKKELLAIPIVGWYLRRLRMIAVDRRGGARALRHMLKGGQEALAHGRPIVIFPEGTRTAPGTEHPYHPGVTALYTKLAAPVVPAALNSGLYWGRRSFVKRPGTVILTFLAPIAPGLDRETFAAELKRRLETASARLRAEAEAYLGQTLLSTDEQSGQIAL